jgi:hypothetical protein
VNTSILDLSPEWTYADFNVLGNGSYGTATFNNGGSNQLWQYSGSGTNWAPITGTNTQVLQVAETVAPY